MRGFGDSDPGVAHPGHRRPGDSTKTDIRILAQIPAMVGSVDSHGDRQFARTRAKASCRHRTRFARKTSLLHAVDPSNRFQSPDKDKAVLVAAFDQDIRADGFDQFGRSVFWEEDDKIDGGQCCENFSAIIFILNRPSRSF